MRCDRIVDFPKLPLRPDEGYKGTFGKVGIVGGCAGMHRGEEFTATMIGAPALSALGAIRCGCGIVMIAAPAPIIEHVLSIAPFATGFGLEVNLGREVIASHAAPVLDEMVRLSNVIVAGMGMCQDASTGQIILRLVNQEEVPVVIDASGLSALAQTPDFVRDIRANAVLTPHPGEARKLMDALSIEGDPAGDADARSRACAQLARRTGCVVVLKGKGTVVSDGQRDWVCDRGHPALGVGGSGDVLAGAIGSIIAQTRESEEFDLFTASVLAVNAHAVAGERWTEDHRSTGGMIATELADTMMSVVEGMRETP